MTFFFATTCGCKVKGQERRAAVLLRMAMKNTFGLITGKLCQKYGASRRAWSALAPEGRDLLPSASSLR